MHYKIIIISKERAWDHYKRGGKMKQTQEWGLKQQMKQNFISHHWLLLTIKHFPLLVHSRKFVLLPDAFCWDGAFLWSRDFSSFPPTAVSFPSCGPAGQTLAPPLLRLPAGSCSCTGPAGSAQCSSSRSPAATAAQALPKDGLVL